MTEFIYIVFVGPVIGLALGWGFYLTLGLAIYAVIASLSWLLYDRHS